MKIIHFSTYHIQKQMKGGEKGEYRPFYSNKCSPERINSFIIRHVTIFFIRHIWCKNFGHGSMKKEHNEDEESREHA